MIHRLDPLGGQQDEAAAASHLLRAAEERKCRACGCMHAALADIDAGSPTRHGPPLEQALNAARSKLKPERVRCRGCDPCYPIAALDALGITDRCSPQEPDDKERPGWPPLPGEYVVLRYHAPVAVCTLNDPALARAVAAAAEPQIAIVGPLRTENLGIERLILNVLANPNIRFLVLCGPDSRQAVGHLPGQALVALGHFGIDAHAGIIGARGRRPALANIGREAIEHYRQTVEIVDCVEVSDPLAVLEATRRCAAADPGPAPAFFADRTVPTVAGKVSGQLTPDPAGYFVIYIDRQRRKLLLEHYSNTGLLDVVIEGESAAALYMPVIARSLISRLDHAAYLGRELARAEQALQSGRPYVQDAAPQQ